MYKSYKIKESELQNLSNLTVEDYSLNNSEEIKNKLLKMVKSSSLHNAGLRAESIWDDWFPEIKADVFISHSSKDGEVARKFKYWLKKEFGLTAFIDSDIWGHSDELLRTIDDEYCKHSNGTSYSYELRNGSTAHVHMMLSYALTRMIDKTECFMFLESNNSVTAEDSIKGTYSPWIFHELATVDTIELKKPSRPIHESVGIEKTATFSKAEFKVVYPVFGRRLMEISNTILTTWRAGYSVKKFQNKKVTALDALYNLVAEQEV